MSGPVEVPADPDEEREWIFTFGGGHEDAGGASLAMRYVRIRGTFATSRAEMLERFGRKWSMQYPSEDDAGVGKYGLTELELAPLPPAVVDETSVTPFDAANLATNLAPALIEEAVAAIPREQLPLYLVRFEQAREIIAQVRKLVELRMVQEGMKGRRFRIGDRNYGFWGSLQKGFKNLPGLLVNLRALGMSLEDITDAVSEARVTQLRASASQLRDETKRKAALELIEEHRVAHGTRGDPHLVELERVI